MRIQPLVSNLSKVLGLSNPNTSLSLYKKVLVQMTPFCVAILVDKLNTSGLHDRSGDLRRCISESQLYIDKKGLRISPGGGFSKDVYVRLNTFTFGGVVGSGVKSQKIKKSIKRSGKAPAGVQIIEGRGIYRLDGAEVERVQDKFDELLNVELENSLK